MISMQDQRIEREKNQGVEKLDLTFKHKYLTRYEEARKHDKMKGLLMGIKVRVVG